MTIISDREIILKIKNGEINYFEIIVKKYTSKIYQLIKTKILIKEDVEDLVQNAFIKFYKAINRFNEKLPILPYLYQIAKNELKMYYRSKKNFLPLKENFKNEDERSFFERFERKEDYLKKLKKEEKEMIMMLVDGFSYKEIAEKFKKSLNTVKSIVRRARRKLIINK
ncbi:MAG: sigma-70 family RNA polymerase sigma factor [Patescibacteria group bacterium]|nr:sigma-70 family RNA polymerase sigma factor [Patescibacteria group bacterium]